MTNDQTGTLVLKDTAGNYFLVSLETLKRGQVPAEQRAELERLIAEQQDEVQGYVAAAIYQMWADQGNFLRDYFERVGRPTQYGDPNNQRSGPVAAP